MAQVELLEAQEQFSYTQVSTHGRKPSAYQGSLRMKITIPTTEVLNEDVETTIQKIEAFFNDYDNITKKTELYASKKEEEGILALSMKFHIKNIIDINTDGSTKQIKKILMDWFMNLMKIYPGIEVEVFVFNVL